MVESLYSVSSFWDGGGSNTPSPPLAPTPSLPAPSLPSYLEDDNDHKRWARKVFVEGQRARSGCIPCLDAGVECVGGDGYSKCAYCTSTGAAASRCTTSSGRSRVASSFSSRRAARGSVVQGRTRVAKGAKKKKKSVVAVPRIPPVSSRPTATTPSRVSSFFVRSSLRFVIC